MTFWFFDGFGVGPSVVFADPYCFPLIFCHLSIDLCSMPGVLSEEPPPHQVLSSRDLLALTPFHPGIAINSSCLTPCVPRCVGKFNAVCCGIDWPTTTWSSLFLFLLDQSVIDLNWKIAPVSLTGQLYCLNSSLFLTVYDAPQQLPDSALEECLNRIAGFLHPHGKVYGYPNAFNGIRHYRVKLDGNPIPFQL